jgi:hypothetical protein
MGRTQHSSNVDDERDDCGSDHPWENSGKIHLDFAF